MATIAQVWANLGAATASLMFVWTMIQQFLPNQIRHFLLKYSHRFTRVFYPYVQIIFPEFSGETLQQSEAYSAIQNYLSAKSSKNADRLKDVKILIAEKTNGSKSLVLSMGDHQEVTDEFNGIKIWWSSGKHVSENPMPFSYHRANREEKRYYKLTLHKHDRETVIHSYLEHVLTEGKVIGSRNQQRKLYTNNPSQDWFGWRQKKWNHVSSGHPATFETLAMGPKKKEEIKKDLIKFKNGKEYYTKIGKPWKRGYLLYGPPGTGKSTMISAMANFLDYDVYDLELTTVKDNTELRRLLIETSGKSIIVIEDIDCSLDLTGQRKKKTKNEGVKEERDKEEDENKPSKITLSGLLNFIDGIWSACGGERVIVFTTNHVEKLDAALIRRGRMDMHIEMSYCRFEAFKVLAKNYLDVESHELFGEIETLLKETDMTPADVAETLMPKSDDEDAKTCLKNLIDRLEAAKEDAKKKAEEEAKKKAEDEEKKKENSAHSQVEGIETENSAEEVTEDGFISKKE